MSGTVTKISGRRGSRGPSGLAQLAGAALTIALIACVAGPSEAQVTDPFTGEALDEDQPVALVADSIEYDSEAGTVTAEGNVEVYYGERTLTADRIVYDSTTDRIAADGAITLRDPRGTTVFADVAELDVDLRDGLVEGARSVIGAGTTARLAAVEARRVDGRYNALSKAVYSPCDVCEDSPTPLWRIRARRVIHDEEARIVHYEDAYFDFFGVPIGYLPYFQHPDPTVERATGFLTPDFRAGNFGFGLRTPFFIAIDDQSDLTLQPFFTSEDGSFLDLQYRHLFRNGALNFRGSVGTSTFTGEQELLGHVDTDGLFDLSALDDGARWGWDVKFASDDDYLGYYDISDEDRLTSELFLRNYWNDGFYEIEALYFQSLRGDEPAGDIPRVLPDVALRKEFGLPRVGGELGLFADTQTLFRNEGEDTTRISLGADWEREFVLPVGLALRGFAELRGDLFLSFQDAGVGEDDTELRFAPLAGLEARYPLIWQQESGSAHIVEPIAQFIAAPFGGNGEKISNEDSQQTEFDEFNLFSESRFSGFDAVEEGPRFNLGIRYELLSDDGLRFDATVGRVVRFAEADEFQAGTGLNGTTSDWVAAWSAGYRGIASVRQRLRFDSESLSRNEVFGSLNIGPANLGAGYVFLEETPFTVSEDDREEITALAALQVTPEWRVSSYMQRDLQVDEFVAVGGSLSFANECCALDLFLRRNFTESENDPASTSFGVQLRLLTLGSSVTRDGLFGDNSFTDFRDSLSGASQDTDFTTRVFEDADR